MIYLCHFEQGVPFHQVKESQTEFGEKLGLAVANKEPQLLRPRERRLLTSGFVEGRFFQHTVQVNKSGNHASFTVLSIRFSPALLGRNLVFLPESKINNFKRVIISDQNPFMAVALPSEEPGLVHIVDLVYYRPSVSKVRSRFHFSLN